MKKFKIAAIAAVVLVAVSVSVFLFMPSSPNQYENAQNDELMDFRAQWIEFLANFEENPAHEEYRNRSRRIFSGEATMEEIIEFFEIKGTISSMP
ncbi:MAG: hypothetical protein FWD01_02050, partial [Defluviitaleaceae bacterium]|nr:hypothetical protein [Defluviitaleaceae bacterium]